MNCSQCAMKQNGTCEGQLTPCAEFVTTEKRIADIKMERFSKDESD